MRESTHDITQSIISGEDIRQRLSSIFPDSAILDNQLNIVSISTNILENIGYTPKELIGESISCLSPLFNFNKILEQKLQGGYFEQEEFEIRTKIGESIAYSMSGFYLGLISDMNGLIILKFKNLEEVNRMHSMLGAKTEELDRFVYQSAHSLRGPLATIKGLINLARTSSCQEEMCFLVQQMNVFAERLDDKLHQLIYFAESDKGYESPVKELSVESVFKSLSFSIREVNIDHPVHFCSNTLHQNQTLENGEVVLSMLNNLVLFFCHQPKTVDNLLTFDLLSNSSATEIMIRSKGFLLSDLLIEKMESINFGYSEILNYPELINYYAAKKIMLKLRGNIQFMLIASNEVVVLMNMPRNNQLSHF